MAILLRFLNQHQIFRGLNRDWEHWVEKTGNSEMFFRKKTVYCPHIHRFVYKKSSEPNEEKLTAPTSRRSFLAQAGSRPPLAVLVSGSSLKGDGFLYHALWEPTASAEAAKVAVFEYRIRAEPLRSWRFDALEPPHRCETMVKSTTKSTQRVLCEVLWDASGREENVDTKPNRSREVFIECSPTIPPEMRNKWGRPLTTTNCFGSSVRPGCARQPCRKTGRRRLTATFRRFSEAFKTSSSETAAEAPDLRSGLGLGYSG